MTLQHVRALNTGRGFPAKTFGPQLTQENLGKPVKWVKGVLVFPSLLLLV